MHTFSETGAGVPAFLAKLWRLVEDPETNNLICWSKDGRSFIIQNQAQFARELLPLNYKHNNMASFIRQLNMYGFHKITSIDNGGLKFDRDEMEFTHPCFKRNCPYLLEHIKRKIASTKSVDEKSALKPEAVTKVLQDVKAMRGRQDSLDSRFSVMKQENEALWREIASLRQKHAKQQQIVNKLIQFLITIVQPQRNMTSVKRHMQLMINDIPDKSKLRKTSESESDGGPVIHELGEELLDEVADVEPELMVPNSPFARVATPATPSTDPDVAHSPHNIERPHSSGSMISQNYDFSNQSAEDTGYLSPAATAAAAAANDGLVHTINNDGSKIFYHITEVPDAQPQETNISPVSYNEDNVLTTPMVREEMARNQLLKQKNRQRRIKNEYEMENRAKASGTSGSKVQRLASQSQASPKHQQQQQQQLAQQIPQPIQIKSEQDAALDPMLFLNIYPENRGLTPDPNLISPNFSEDSRQSNSNTTGSFLINTPTSSANTASSAENALLAGNSSDLYNPNSFITNDIPADIFEDNSLISAGENSNIGGNDNFKQALQQQFGRSTVNSGKFSTYLSGSTSGNCSSQPSTSAAAAAAAISSTNNSNNNNNNENSSEKSAGTSKNENGSNMAIAKYKNNQDVMRNEVSGHLDIVQDELEGLKDLLRSDVYSLDHNTLLGMPLNGLNSIQNSNLNTFENNNHRIFLPPAMEEDILNKLFNDSDILGPYGLHLPNDGNDKKGSELMTYQPMYDLSDIINDQNDLEADVNMSPSSALQTQQQPKQEYGSVLNTPYHE
ncbi:heat shock factor protein isoform X2 [Lucilia sericata]|uniref:heat shock factor protein isoform X2 n=1 Tax=Lucilia sericata TaxID=13632 RepID=UPI0018A82124|nr:heat shock factor protein isoform X2 [Lucilia sericata]